MTETIAEARTTSADWPHTGMFNIPGRGTVYTFHRGSCSQAHEASIGDTVPIAGSRWKVMAIERYWRLMHPPLPGDNISLIVKEITDA